MRWFWTILVVVVVAGCHTVDRLYARGDYEEVIERVAKRDRKQKLSEKEVRFAEIAFSTLKEDYLQTIERAEAAGTGKGYEQAFYAIQTLQVLETELTKHSPIVAKNGYVGQFDFDGLEELTNRREYAAKQAADYYFKLGLNELQVARADVANREAAREAYKLFQTSAHFDDRNEVDELKEEAKELGVLRVTTELSELRNYDSRHHRNRPYHRLDYGVKRKLKRMLEINSTNWITYTPNAEDADVLVTLNVINAEVSRVYERSNNRQFSRQIEVEAVDVNGNIIRDTLGNAIMTYETVTATIEETKFWKEGEVALELSIVDLATNRNVLNRYYNEEDEVMVEDCRVYGDSRAISGQQCRRDQNRGANQLPDDDEILEDLIDDIDYKIRNDIQTRLTRL